MFLTRLHTIEDMTYITSKNGWPFPCVEYPSWIRNLRLIIWKFKIMNRTIWNIFLIISEWLSNKKHNLLSKEPPSQFRMTSKSVPNDFKVNFEWLPNWLPSISNDFQIDFRQFRMISMSIPNEFFVTLQNKLLNENYTIIHIWKIII